MTALASVVAQIGDKIADILTGPVVGTVSVTTGVGVRAVLEQGQSATLPGGRRIRVTKTTRVDSTGASVPVRLEILSPSYPVAGNFVAVGAGTTATWLTPPSDVPPTALTSAFGLGVRAGALRIGSFVENDTAEKPNGFVAGAQGDVQLILVGPACKYTSIDSNSRRARCEATWKLRVVIPTLNVAHVARNRAREVNDALAAVLLGATCGDDPVAFVSWQVAKEAKDALSWDLVFRTITAVDGRSMYADDPTIEEFGLDLRLPGDTDQPSGWAVSEDIDID